MRPRAYRPVAAGRRARPADLHGAGRQGTADARRRLSAVGPAAAALALERGRRRSQHRIVLRPVADRTRRRGVPRRAHLHARPAAPARSGARRSRA